MRVPQKIGLALGGGAARGVAHIGVLKVLEEEDIPVHCIAGTSAGSLIGVLSAAGWSWRRIKEEAARIDWGDLIRLGIPRLGVVNPEPLEKLLDRLLEGRDLRDLEVPFCAVATDITSAQRVVLSRGPAARAVRASCSIPGIFEPAKIGGRLLVDGGLVDDVPTEAARKMGATLVIGVNLNGDRVSDRPPESVLEVLLFSLNILIGASGQKGARAAEVAVVPELRGFAYHDLSRLEEMVERGEQAMRRRLPELRRRL